MKCLKVAFMIVMFDLQSIPRRAKILTLRWYAPIHLAEKDMTAVVGNPKYVFILLLSKSLSNFKTFSMSQGFEIPYNNLMLTIPDKVPEKGFYYHYKHDPPGAINNYAYEVVGVGHHTEDDCRPEDANLVVYRPLYETASVYRAGKMFDIRPLGMFMESVTKEGKTFPRFQKITDVAVIAELEAIKRTMYS